MSSITTLGFSNHTRTQIQSKGLSIVINHFAAMLGLICYSKEIKHIRKYYNSMNKNKQKTKF
jgi:hypothetical protein